MGGNDKYLGKLKQGYGDLKSYYETTILTHRLKKRIIPGLTQVDFAIDEKKIRHILQLNRTRNNKKCCDIFGLYVHGVLFLVESKKAYNVDDALEQLEETYNHFKNKNIHIREFFIIGDGLGNEPDYGTLRPRAKRKKHLRYVLISKNTGEVEIGGHFVRYLIKDREVKDYQKLLLDKIKKNGP